MKILDKIKNNYILRTIIISILSFVTVISLAYNLESANSVVNINSPFNIGTIALFVLGICIYKYYNTFYFKDKKSNWLFRLLAIIFAIFMIIGHSYSKTDSWELIFGSIPAFLLSITMLLGYYFLFNRTINLVFDFFNTNKFIQKHSKNNKILKFIFIDHPFASTFVIMLICWLPYIISFYPGILSPDPSNQIKQFFGLDVQYRNYVILLDESVGITNHHPFIHTILLGGCVWIGRALGSDNLGIFIYSIIQTISLLSVLAYSLYYMKKLNTPMWIRIVTLLIYSLVPVFPLYAMSTVKDVLFGVCVIFYIIFLFDLVKNANKNIYTCKKIILLICLMLLTMLLRNNGIYLVLMSFPFLLLIDKKNRLKILLVLLTPLIIFEGYSKILLPSLKITPGSIREMLSIPFQQTARYVKEYGNEVTKEEREAIDKILGYDTLVTRYDPEKSDPVKNEFNKYSTKNDLSKYFKVWFNGLLKHPNVYIEATINNTYGYFYPDAHNWYIYYKYDTRLKDTKEFDYHYNSLKTPRKILSYYGEMFPYIPVIGNIVNIGFSVWICMLIFTFLIKLKKYKYLIYLTPVISLILVCIASPVNTYFRYALPYVFAIPIIIAMFINILNDKKEEM